MLLKHGGITAWAGSSVCLSTGTNHLGLSLAVETHPYLKINSGGCAGQEPPLAVVNTGQITEHREEPERGPTLWGPFFVVTSLS